MLAFSVTVIEKSDKKVTVMSGKPVDIPLPQPKIPTTPQVNASRGPSYNDAFAQFLQSSSKPKPNEIVKNNVTKKEPAAHYMSVIQQAPTKPVSPKIPKNQQKTNLDMILEQQLLQQQQYQQYQMQQQNNYVVDQNQRVKTERIPQNLQNQAYAVQENTVLAQDGEQQKLYYTILDSNAPTLNDVWRMGNGQQYYGQQQQSF